MMPEPVGYQILIPQQDLFTTNSALDDCDKVHLTLLDWVEDQFPVDQHRWKVNTFFKDVYHVTRLEFYTQRPVKMTCLYLDLQGVPWVQSDDELRAWMLFRRDVPVSTTTPTEPAALGRKRK